MGRTTAIFFNALKQFTVKSESFSNSIFSHLFKPSCHDVHVSCFMSNLSRLLDSCFTVSRIMYDTVHVCVLDRQHGIVGFDHRPWPVPALCFAKARSLYGHH